MIVYRAISPSGKSYIGVTSSSLKTRKSQHHFAARNGSNNWFHQALRKYDYQFEWQTLCTVNSRPELYVREIEYISQYDTYHNGYNMTEGGGNVSPCSPELARMRSERMSGVNNHMYGKHCTNLHKQHISESLVGRSPHGLSHTEETKKILSAQRKGIPVPHLSYDWTGKQHTEQTKRKMSMSSPKRIEIVCQETGQLFHSVSELSAHLSVSVSHLCKSFKHKGFYVKGDFTYRKNNESI